MRFVGLLCLLLCLSLPAIAAKIAFPTLSGRVVDQAGLLDADAESQLSQSLAAYEKASGEQIVVVTLQSLQGEEIEDYGYQLGRHWGIGRESKDDGAILIVAPKERAVRIEVGYGLEDRLTDAASALIVNRIILPAFKSGQMQDGILQGANAILKTLGGTQVQGMAGSAVSDGQAPTRLSTWLFYLIVVLFLLMRRKRRSGIGPLIIGSILGGMRGGSRSSGFGGGGFRGGGGGFGGGGASGRW